MLALRLSSGAMSGSILEGGVNAIAAWRTRLRGRRRQEPLLPRRARGSTRWSKPIGSFVSGRIAVDDERVYFAALSNVVYGLDRAERDPAVDELHQIASRSPESWCSATWSWFRQ